MKHCTRPIFSLLAAAAFTFAAGCNSSNPAPLLGTSTDLFGGFQAERQAYTVSSELRPRMQPPSGQVLLGHSTGRGTMVYTCGASTDEPSRSIWVPSRVDAELRDDSGRVIGKQFGDPAAGPTFEGNDGSRLTTGVAYAIPSESRTGAPRLLLRTERSEVNGLFSGVSYVQQLNTRGGGAPTIYCDGSNPNHEVRVPYSADYYYWGPAPTVR